MLSAGTRLGPYEIQSAIGAGGMGEVYRARDTRLDRPVAIKVLPSHFADDPDFRQRFEREARAVSSLNHPNICTLYDVGNHDGTDYLVLEYLEGETLAALVGTHVARTPPNESEAAQAGGVGPQAPQVTEGRRNQDPERERRQTRGGGAPRESRKRPLPIPDALHIAVQICDALEVAHRQGIVHRDLKPANVMLTKSGGSRHGLRQVKVLDFGLAKFKASEASMASGSMVTMPGPGLTGQGMILGTLQYMAPEQIEGHEADARADLFALGTILYEMVTGRKAFEAKSQASLVAAILEHEPPPMATIQPVTPAPLERVVRKCLTKDPEARWQSARDLGDELRWVAEAGSGVGAAPVQPVSGRGPRSTVAWIVAAVAVLVALAASVPAVRYLRSTPEVAPEMRLQIVTPRTPSPLQFALSPDARYLVFLAAAEGTQTELWLRPLAAANPQRLAGTDRASYPFWSPDSRSIGFFADGKLKRLDLAGGAVQTVTNAPAGRGGTWNRDGVILFTPNASSPLYRVPAAGGEATALTRVEGATSHRFPQFLPDGRHFLYFVQGGSETLGVYVAALDDTKGRRLVATDTNGVFEPPDRFVFLRQGTLFSQRFDMAAGSLVGDPAVMAEQVAYDSAFNIAAVSVSSTGVIAYRAGSSVGGQELVWVDRGGKQVDLIRLREPGPQFCPELSPDGRRIVLDRTVNGNRDIWILEPARSVETRFTFDSAADATPIWSPDASRVVFRSVRSGTWDLYQKPASGAGVEERLVATDQYKVPADWSPDGRFLLFGTLDPTTNLDVWAVPLDGDRKPFPIAKTTFEERDGQFSPDGRWVAYASNESGQFQIYLQPFPDATGGKWQLSTGGGTQPRWRRDGKELFYVAPDGTVMAVSVTLSATARSVDVANPVQLFASRINAGQSGLLRHQYAVSADGKRFLLNAVTEAAMVAPVTVMLNWRPEK
ncbi:MAG: protein kinase [Acidobacteria bacterium]|nr:protein kinase [Acidobacteriota bacterium]